MQAEVVTGPGLHYGLLVHSWPPKSLRAGLAGHMDPASEEETPEEGAWRTKEITTAGAGNSGRGHQPITTGTPQGRERSQLRPRIAPKAGRPIRQF